MNAIGEWIWYNNKLIKTAEINSPIPESANRIYEVLRVINGKPLFLNDHFNRFLTSCAKLNIQTTLTTASVDNCIKSVLRINTTANCNIRFEQILEENLVSFACYLVPYAYPQAEAYLCGVSLGTYSAERPDPQIKQSVVNQQIRNTISTKFNNQDVFEILLVDHKGCITEGSRSNVFFVKNNTLISPPSKDILIGITRMKVLEIASRYGMTYKEESISFVKLATFDACFLTGTSPKVLPVARINNTPFQANHPLVLEIIDKYEELIRFNV